ncbi:hypothetical protein SDC9_107832 [bioreactor metagenome]|uniref:Uncharacterized protein n=1 Tax=bioreactor metagenome TaxID=1076179 RepID=A0A645B7F1_9ZZZZ
MVDRHELQVEIADLQPGVVADDLQHRLAGQPVLLELGLDQRQGELAAVERQVRTLTQQVGHGADVVLVAVGEHQRHHVVEAVLDELEGRQQQVDTGMVVLGEQHAAVDQQQLPVDLETRHVPPDVSQPAQRDDTQGAGSEGGRGLQAGRGHLDSLAHRRSPLRSSTGVAAVSPDSSVGGTVQRRWTPGWDAARPVAHPFGRWTRRVAGGAVRRTWTDDRTPAGAHPMTRPA